MNIILQGYNTCCQNKYGGVQKRIRKIFDLLSERNVNVELYNSFETQIKKESILHVFMLNFENYQLVKCVKSRGGKVVISTIVNLCNGAQIDFCRNFLNKAPILTTYKMHTQMLELADLIITETYAETEFLSKHYKIPKSRFVTIPNGVEEPEAAGNEIYDILGKRCRYVLVVGRFDENKNQLNVIKALKTTDIDVVFVGGSDFAHEKYYKKCQEAAEGHDNIHFLGWLDKESALLASAYQNADTFVMPSFHETFGFALLEGAMAGAKLAISDQLPILKYKTFCDSETFHPSDITDIKNCVTKVFQAKKNNELMDKLKKEFSWDSVVEEHIRQYKKLYLEE